MYPLVSREFAALVQRCSCAPCAALRSTLGAPVIKVANANEFRVRFSSLDQADKHFLCLVALGLSNRQIGERVGMTRGTVKYRLHVLFAKLGVKDRTAAALRAQELGLSEAVEDARPPGAVLAPEHVVSLLSAEERRTLGLVSRGLSNREISRTLNLAESTVKNRLVTMFKKLGVRGRTQAALAAVRLGLIRVDSDDKPRRRALLTSAETRSVRAG